MKNITYFQNNAKVVTAMICKNTLRDTEIVTRNCGGFKNCHFLYRAAITLLVVKDFCTYDTIRYEMLF